MNRYLICTTGILLSACTTVSYDLHSKSHYDYPNSNIKPLGEAVGNTRQVSFLLPPQQYGEIERQAVEAALLTKPGSDLLINYVSETKITILPFYVFIMDYTVHGTAASMSIGPQKLK